ERERGIHATARKAAAVLVADGLGLAEPARALFVAAARGRGPAVSVLAAVQGEATGAAAAAASKTLPGDIAAFTGRQAELTQLVGGIDSLGADGGGVGILAIDGMAGIGKRRFAGHGWDRPARRVPC